MILLPFPSDPFICMNRSINPELLCSGRSCSVGKFHTPMPPPKPGPGPGCAEQLSARSWYIQWWRWDCQSPETNDSEMDVFDQTQLHGLHTPVTQLLTGVLKQHPNGGPTCKRQSKVMNIGKFIFLILLGLVKETGEITISIKCHEKKKHVLFHFFGT